MRSHSRIGRGARMAGHATEMRTGAARLRRSSARSRRKLEHVGRRSPASCLLRCSTEVFLNPPWRRLQPRQRPPRPNRSAWPDATPAQPAHPGLRRNRADHPTGPGPAEQDRCLTLRPPDRPARIPAQASQPAGAAWPDKRRVILTGEGDIRGFITRPGQGYWTYGRAGRIVKGHIQRGRRLRFEHTGIDGAHVGPESASKEGSQMDTTLA